MIKLSALNDESDDDSDSEEEVSREALEQIALQQYAKALELQRKGNLPDATQLLKDLLDTELLYEVKKPERGEKVTGPLFNLKYLCYKNLASMLSAGGELEAAIDAYLTASNLDDTDITLWHRLGLLCMRAKKYELALQAFQKGVDRNPRHWPCLDKLVLLTLALDFKEQCIAVIHETLQLDPGYLRGLAYRKYIYKLYPHMKDYMEYLNPIYKCNEDLEDPLNNKMADNLVKEAEEIQEIYTQQQRDEKFKHIVPNLILNKPITRLSWEALGAALVHMHKYMTEHCYSHACFIQLIMEIDDCVSSTNKMEVCEEEQINKNAPEGIEEEVAMDVDKLVEEEEKKSSENENNDLSDREKTVTDTEKVESDVENKNELISEISADPKTQKKSGVRRRGSDLSFLQQWEWCKNRRSGRKKVANKQDDNIYDTLRRMVPIPLIPEMIKRKENQTRETSPKLEKFFDEKENTKVNENEVYFNSDLEQNDVKSFIKKYIENKKDIIDMLKDYLMILSLKWKQKWPTGLIKTFIAANDCYSNHIDNPACTNDNFENLIHYTLVNLLVVEFTVNEELDSKNTQNITQHLCAIDTIEVILRLKPQILEGMDLLETVLRQLWQKMHIFLLNKSYDSALDYLYKLYYEFEAMGDQANIFCLELVNFTFKPLVNLNEVLEYIKFLERNKMLSTVQDLFNKECYEDVLTVVIDSFEHCKNSAKQQEEEMCLDFAVQLSLILDSYWALGKADECFKWSFICLHEALKHYFRFTSGSAEYEKWSLIVVKILKSMEHILSTQGFSCIDVLNEKDLSQGLEDLIRIIGHQVETNSTDMPVDTIAPWIVMHYILQREEDQGRGRYITDKDKVPEDEIPNPIMVLFIAHEHLGKRGWCAHSDSKLLYFILDTIVPRIRSPALSKSLEQISQYMEQCVFCLYGHPEKKSKVKYLLDHNVPPRTLDWERAQQLYEIFRPPILPALEGKLSGISSDTEALFLRIITLLPNECDPQKYISDLEKYIKGVENKLPLFPPLLPYKMKDIYFLLGDYYFKKEDGKMAVKYNMLDVIINNDRLESWAQISLAKAINLERVLNSCKNIHSEREFLNPAKSTIRCFKRSLELDPSRCSIWIEFGNFAYTVHSFCSRLLKQASESLSMEDFEELEQQKENLLEMTQKCFTSVLEDLNSSTDSRDNEDPWLLYYMLGKSAEKRNKSPSVYLNYYVKGVKSLQETDATYPLKINYSSPTHLCIEVLELHYRIHASILKYIEQHENKPIPASVGKVFLACIEEWQKSPFSKKSRKEGETDNECKSEETSFQAANILKRSISDAGEEDNVEVKRLKLESAAAKVRRSASYDTERNKDPAPQTSSNVNELKETSDATVKSDTTEDKTLNKEESETEKQVSGKHCETEDSRKGESSSSESSSDSSSSESSSESSSDSSDNSTKSVAKNLSDNQIMEIVSDCLDALEDCACRFPPHYKAIYRLAHYHFYYSKGKDIERCRDLMLSSFTSRSGQKLGGLFSERKQSNFFNNIWKIPISEVDRAGSFAFHMNRSVLLTMEILKEIDDHKTLLDLSLHLQRIPDSDKKYLRDSDREDLAQQAFSLSVQSLKGQLLKFSQQSDLKSNVVERDALKSLMIDIYRAYQRVQKQPNHKQFTNLLVDAYKLMTNKPINENMNLVDLSMKYCQSRLQKLKQQATQASFDKIQQLQKKREKESAKAESVKSTVASAPPPVTSAQSNKTEAKQQPSLSTLPKMSSHDIAAAFQSYVPLLNESVMSQQTAAALSYLTNMSAYAGYPSLQSSLQTSLQNTFQAEFYRQFLGPNISSYNLPAKKSKRGPKPGSTRNTTLKKHKSFSGLLPKKAAPTPVITSLQKSSSALAPSMGTILTTLPASMSMNLPSYAQTNIKSVPQAHMSTATTVSAAIHTKPPLPHQQVSPGKTLQEKLAERQKHMPSVSKSTVDINASISRLPSSLTITKSSVPKSAGQVKKTEVKKSLAFDTEKCPRPITSDEIIVLDDDD
ncbi:calcineurin-binding protein cabin-1-like [Leptidea sinapis]|uniref:calcineurin-binding protein cabin-1-like n=1 Tax=Leptidea sinapis TaxID=189913 RepID=UPI00212CE67D|nr:calcineurin-binding protein cabin-1-like [Leptidea sinapis]XP_050679519.1 calcineurin-binding protein cabin-1-like [Leptidea sinapis]